MVKMQKKKGGVLLLVVLVVSACAMRGAGLVTAANPGSGIVATGNMTVARFDHTATLLPNGQVLIVGGLERNGVIQPTAELFDPATGRFTLVGKPQSPRGWGAAATLLPNGKVLVAGGVSGSCGSSCYLKTAELYDPSTRAFVLTGSMTVARAGAISVLLPTGDVLIVGGTETSARAPFASAELYHSGTGSFSSGPPLHMPDPIQAVLLKSGNVLVVGASGAELYDPGTGRFTPTGKMTDPRAKFGAALLPDGRVLIAGGQTGGPWGQRVAGTQVYDPVSGRFTSGPELNRKRFKLMKAVVPLGDGRILVGGGADQPEIYDPASGAFLLVAGSKLDGFCFSTATLLNDGKVLLAGGYGNPGGAGVSHAWLFQP